MPEISADLTAAAIIQRTLEKTASVDGVVRRLVYSDDFSRSVAKGLGGSWIWYPYDSYPAVSSDTASMLVDGSVAIIAAETGSSIYESYIGFPWPRSGDLYYDFWVPATWSSNRPTYGWTLREDDYWGVYTIAGAASQWKFATWTTNDPEYLFTPTPSTWYRVHVRWSSSSVYANVWDRSTAEPAGWQYTAANEWNLDGVEAPFLDMYYSPTPPVAGKIDNIEIWSSEASWPVYGGMYLDAQIIGTGEVFGAFSAGAVISERGLFASAVLFKSVQAAPTYTGSVDTFTGSQLNLFDHTPDSGPKWESGSGFQGGVLRFDGKWWAYQNGYSEMETGQNDYDLTFNYYGYGAISLYLRFTDLNSVVFILGQTTTPGAFGYARITEMVNGSMSYSTNRAGFTQGQSYAIRVVLTGRSALLYVDNSLAYSYTVTRDLTPTRLKLKNDTGSGTVIDNWNFPYYVPGTSFLASAEIIDNYKVTGTVAADAYIRPRPLPDGGGGGGGGGGDVPAKSTIIIRINGVDVTDDVLFNDAEFMSQASGSPGTCRFRLKDMNYIYSIVVGQTLTLEIDGRKIWGGWVQSIKRQFFFPYTGSPLPNRRNVGPNYPKDDGWDPCGGVSSGSGGESGSGPITVPRALVVEGVDYNILFNKRYVFKKSNPVDGSIKSWPAGTADSTMIEWMCENALDLSGDGLDTTTMVEYVGTPNPDERGNPAGGGDKWADAMRAIARYPGAVWYINPDKQLVYTDVDTRNAGYKLTDVPETMYDLGYRDMEILYNGSNLVNDAMVWGAGQGSNRVRFQRTRDSASIAAHGLWQVGDFRGDLWRQASVDKRSRSFVYGSPQNKRGGKDDAISVSVTLYQPAFRVAEKVDFWSHTYGFNDVLPVRRMRVTFPTTRDARYDLVLSHAIDEPWNTFEYWFPPIPKPIIVVPVTDDEYCPVPNPPSNTYDEPGVGLVSIANFVSVFSDDFERASGQPAGGLYGYWSTSNGVPVDPLIIDGALRLYLSSRYIFLKQPIYGSRQLIMALDLSDWVANATYAGSGSISFTLGSISNKGIIMCWGSDYGYMDPTLFCGKKVFVRAVHYVDRYSAVKIWPQDQPEPAKWNMTGPAYSAEPSVMGMVSFAVQGYEETNLMGVTVFANAMGNDDWALANWDVDQNGWTKGWAYPPPDDRNDYAVTWGEDYENQTNNQDVSYNYSIVWGYFGPDHGGGWPNGASQAIASRWTRYHPAVSIGAPQLCPISIRVEGKVRFTLGRSKGIDNRGDYPGETSVLFAFQAETITDGQQPYWVGGDNPYWLGQDVLYVERVLVWDADGVWEDFSFDVMTGAAVNQTGHFRWGVKVFNPLDACRSMDSRGGPFMLPNTGGVHAQTSNVKFYGIWETIGGAGHFCTPNNTGGGVSDQKTCEAIPINSIQMHELFRNGELWAVQLQQPYQPGTVDVTVDGTPAKQTLDFIESNPNTGVITFLNSFYSAKEIYVCYIPMENDVVEPTPPYVPPGGESQPW